MMLIIHMRKAGRGIGEASGMTNHSHRETVIVLNVAFQIS
jgi:hypothetical protein